jgi:hypothetical protein
VCETFTGFGPDPTVGRQAMQLLYWRSNVEVARKAALPGAVDCRGQAQEEGRTVVLGSGPRIEPASLEPGILYALGEFPGPYESADKGGMPLEPRRHVVNFSQSLHDRGRDIGSTLEAG